jgi:hypothetical protein
MRKYVLLAALSILSGCGIAMQHVSQDEERTIYTAVEPSSEAAAEKAAAAYISDMLVDPDSAKFTFLAYRRGHKIQAPFYDQNRMFGFFMCGTVNAKNRMGGYSGRSTFVVFFDPARQDVVTYGTIDKPSAQRAATNTCEDVYGASVQTNSVTAAHLDSDWTKGFDSGLRNGPQAQCIAAPNGITNADDWSLGCRSGQKAR